MSTATVDKYVAKRIDLLARLVLPNVQVLAVTGPGVGTGDGWASSGDRPPRWWESMPVNGPNE